MKKKKIPGGGFYLLTGMLTAKFAELRCKLRCFFVPGQVSLHWGITDFLQLNGKMYIYKS